KFELREYISKISYNQLIQDILSQKLQKTFAGILKKVCPLKTFEIRVIELVNKNKKAPEAKKVEEPKAEEKAVEKAAEETSKKTTQKKAKKKQEKTEEKEE
ncbi:hypothetical protein KY308_02315, partial [Candidatus Woesearchaeota archaeon]|nr:hypothetical protein [Candidatus Woesearchaeota archaeon]